jgi:2,3-bisphosphoglycerate-dependent phosphoglycerate mutase
MPYLILIRHGQSQWNLENRFTGWIDVDLSEKGEEEARRAAQLLKNYPVDMAFTSALKRAQRTLTIILNQLHIEVPIEKDQALNERMYGDLQGQNKAEAAAKFGEQQVHIWRRSFDIAPPNGESLKDTCNRVIPYYEKHISPQLANGKNIWIAAHGNSLRGLMMHLEKISKENILKLELPTATPVVYELNSKQEIVSKKLLD